MKAKEAQVTTSSRNRIIDPREVGLRAAVSSAARPKECAPPQARVPEVRDAIDNQDKLLSVLVQNVSELAARIEPILSRRNLTPGGCSEPDCDAEPPRCGLAEALVRHNSQLAQAVNNLSALIASVEL